MQVAIFVYNNYSLARSDGLMAVLDVMWICVLSVAENKAELLQRDHNPFVLP